MPLPLPLLRRQRPALMAVPNPKGTEADTKYSMGRQVIKAKWWWHGQQSHCLERLEALRRDTGRAGAHNPQGG